MDHFEAFINYFEDDDYADWIENKASDAQIEKALPIRQPVNESELEALEREQLEESTNEPERVYITPKKENDKQAVQYERQEYIPQQPRQPIGYDVEVQQERKQISLDNAIKDEQIRKQQSKSIRNRISGFFNRFRRGKK